MFKPKKSERGAVDKGRAGTRPEGAAGQWGYGLATVGVGGEHGRDGEH